MPTIGGMWISEVDDYGRSCWVNSATGEMSYDLISTIRGPPPRHHSMETPRYDTSTREHGTPPPSSGYNDSRQNSQAQRPLTGSNPPPPTLPASGRKARYHRQGKKSWVNSVTGMWTRRDQHL